MPTSTRDQIIIPAASNLTKALLTSHNNSLLPTLGTDTREHLVDLANTFHQLLLKNNDTTLPSLTAPLPRVQPIKPSYSTAQVIPTVTKKLVTPRVTPPRVIQQRVTIIPKTVQNITAKLPRMAVKNKAITSPLPSIATQIHGSLNLRRSPCLHRHISHG